MMKHWLTTLTGVAVTLIGASLISFFLIRMIPGDPVLNLLGERGGSPEQIADMRARMGMDKPIVVQYFMFIGRALKGDLGDSVVSKRPVMEEFWDRFPATAELGLMAILWATIVGIPLGIMAAVRQHTPWDYGVMSLSLVGYSMPIFWWGLLLILFFSVQLGWFPVGGRMDIAYELAPVTGFYLIDAFFTPERWEIFGDVVRHLFLPALVLGTIPLAMVARMTRASLLEVLQEDYMRTVRSLRVPRWKQVSVYALRNALIPVITILGVLVGGVLTGAVLTETIFSWPGVGRWLVKSIEARDYPVVQGGILLASLGVVIVNLFVDITYTIVNPRMRRRA